MTHAALIPTSDAVSPYLLAPALIPGLPEHLQEVPADPVRWAAWKQQILAYRELTRREAEKDPKQRAVELKLCANDPAYWLTMYAVILEPRSVDQRTSHERAEDTRLGRTPDPAKVRKAGWYRWVPFAFQVQVIRAVEATMATDELGRGDLIVEKSREMGVSWTICAYISHQFLFADVFVAGVVSRNAESVDKTGDTDTLFFKIRANLGLEEQVPPQMRLPAWMRPKGLTKDDTTLRVITHPTKTCVIKGETTTSLSGVGGRATLRFNDEAARFDDFDATWPNQAATSNHRIAVSSADTKSPSFKTLADLGRQAIVNPQLDGPTMLRLEWHLHPFHTPEWYANEKARFRDQPHWFSREYDIDYFAGSGDTVYPRFGLARLVSAPYDPYLGTLWCTIDPGVADPSAIVWIQEDSRTRRFRVVDAFEGSGGEDADFYASVLVGIPVSGFGGYDYGAYPGLIALMEWTRTLNRPVIYYGDPYGAAKMGDGKRSFFDALRETSSELTGGANVVHVHTMTKTATGDARSHLERKNALSKLASRIDFHDNAGGMRVLTALKESRYPERKEGRGYVTEVLEPQHDRFSHLRSAMEFWAVNITQREVVQAKPSARPVRISMSGKVIR